MVLEQKQSKKELLERINQSYTRLEETLRNLNDEQLARPPSSDWAIKDHLAHLAAWELGIAELIQHRSRFAAMGINEASLQGKSEDEVNDLIYQQVAHLSPEQAKQKLEFANQQMLKALETLSDEDIYKPYNAFLPEGSQGSQKPILNWIVGNTYEHFDEHNGYIRKLLQAAGKQG